VAGELKSVDTLQIPENARDFSLSTPIPQNASLLLGLVALLAYREATWIRSDFGESTPSETVRRMYDKTTRGYYNAQQAYRTKNRNEILETLEIADSQERGEWAIVFVRYSIGTDIHRKAHWLRQVDGAWYDDFYFRAEDVGSGTDDAEWFTEMSAKRNEWDDEDFPY
jgi:hypothetical protein